MAIERTGFQIDMTADASGLVKGAGEGKAALDGVAQSTKDLNASLSEGKGKMEEHAEGMKLFAGSTHEVHAGLRALNEVIPGVEHMARFLSNTLTVEMGAGALAIGFVKSKIDEMDKALDDLQASPGARGEWVDRIKEKLEESAVALAVWEAGLERTMKAQQTLQELAERSLAVDREHLTTSNQLAQAQKELDLARLELRVKLGEVTPEQAIKIRLEIDEAAFKSQLEVKQKEIEAEIGVRTKEKNDARNNALDADEQVQSTKAAADAAAAAKIKNDSKIEQDKKNLEAALEAQKKAQEVIDRLQGKGMWGGNYDKSDPQYYELQTAQESYESNARIAGNLQKSITQETGKKTGLDTAAETSKAEYEDAKRKYEDAVKLHKELENKIAALQQDFDAEKAKTAALETIHGQTGATKARTDEVEQANARRQGEARSGQYANSPQGESDYWINRGNAAAAAAQAGRPGAQAELHATIDKLVSVLGEHVDRTDADRQDLQDTKTRLSRIEQQVHNNRF